MIKNIFVGAAAVALLTTPLGPLSAQPPSPPSAITKVAPESDVPPRAGMAVFSVDGHKIGSVESIDATPDGRITAVNVTTGGFLGFGTKLVAIAEGKFAMVGNVVRVDMTAEDVSALPHHGP